MKIFFSISKGILIAVAVVGNLLFAPRQDLIGDYPVQDPALDLVNNQDWELASYVSYAWWMSEYFEIVKFREPEAGSTDVFLDFNPLISSGFDFRAHAGIVGTWPTSMQSWPRELRPHQRTVSGQKVLCRKPEPTARGELCDLTVYWLSQDEQKTVRFLALWSEDAGVMLASEGVLIELCSIFPELENGLCSLGVTYE